MLKAWGPERNQARAFTSAKDLLANELRQPGTLRAAIMFTVKHVPSLEVRARYAHLIGSVAVPPRVIHWTSVIEEQ